MQYTYCPISHKVKEIRQWNLVSYYNITWETFSFKNHTKCGGETIPRPFSKKVRLRRSLYQ